MIGYMLIENLKTFAQIVDSRRDLRDTTAHAIAAESKATEALAVKSDFIANMTHEIRTPLTSILGFTELLRQSKTLKENDFEQVELISQASGNLLRIANDILDFAKLEAGGMELDRRPFDPRELAISVEKLLSGQAASKGLTLVVTVSGEGRLIGDAERLQQVLINFISNSIKFSSRGEIRVTISQDADGDRRRLRLSVADEGIGIAPDQVEKIFSRFTQADTSVSRRFGGTGLGLAISKKIIDQMDGRLGVLSSLGGGATFWAEVSLSVAPDVIDMPDMDDPTTEPDASELNVLVVEDNAVNRRLVCALLKALNVTFETACDGSDAIDAVSRKSFDLILMDIQMPNMDGVTATKLIRSRASRGARHIPIIAMTANVLPEQIAGYIAAGMDDHLGKPIDTRRLGEIIEYWRLAHRNHRDAAAR